MSSSPTITLKDIAEKAGVSIMTVSRALRKQDSVSAATRERIEKIARDLGYRPNPLVSALMTYRRAANPVQSFSTLGYVTNYPKKDAWQKYPLFQEFFAGAAEAADRHGFKLEEFWLREPGMSAERLSEVLYNRSIPGLIIAPLPVAKGHLRLDWDKFSAVTFGYSLARPLLHRAVNHQFRSMRMMLRQLRKYGYHRIGLAMPNSLDSRVDHQWSGSFLGEQHRMEIGHVVPLFLVDDEQWTEANFLAWYKKNKPDVVLSLQPEVLEWLKKAGARVPTDVGFVHMNCPDKSGTYAGIYQNGHVVGAVAVDFLVGMIQRAERGIPDLAHSILVEGTWIDGATLKPR